MFDFSNVLNLPFIWGGLIVIAIFLYVLLDGFDLGIGILFPFAPSDQCRDRMMNSIAPFWDGNETWLVLGGGGLFAAFPLAYAILMPAFYIPIILMLSGLILRGVAFEFRFKAERSRIIWDYVFHFGSMIAALCQGMILGSFVQGVSVEGRNFVGGPFDWINAFSIMTGLALVTGYILLGSTWLVMKTDALTQKWARRVVAYILGFTGFFMVLVTISFPVINKSIMQFWFQTPNFYYLALIPAISLLLYVMTWRELLVQRHDALPFLFCIGIFMTGYAGLILSIYPWMIPYHFTFTQAASSGASLSFLLVGVAPLLPLILGYTAWCYYVFRGKTSHENFY